MEETPWDDSYHRSSFFLRPKIETHFEVPVDPHIHVFHQDIFSEGNLGFNSATIPIDILVKPGVVENVHIDPSCSPDEIETYKALFK